LFSTITPSDPHTGRNSRATHADARLRHSLGAPQTADEADEMRLLVEVARWNDQTAFEKIFTRHRSAVTRVALQICRDAGTAEAIAQHTFTALWERAERLVDKSIRLRPWLTTVARNAALDHMRAERPCNSIDGTAEIPSSIPSPEDAAIAADSKANLTQALATLSADQRAAIEFVYVAEMTYQAAADALGEPIGTIKSRVRLAIGHLRKRLETVDR